MARAAAFPAAGWQPRRDRRPAKLLESEKRPYIASTTIQQIEHPTWQQFGSHQSWEQTQTEALHHPAQSFAPSRGEGAVKRFIEVQCPIVFPVGAR
jgi:hypothetical protein